jgi:hypothetical protein
VRARLAQVLRPLRLVLEVVGKGTNRVRAAARAAGAWRRRQFQAVRHSVRRARTAVTTSVANVRTAARRRRDEIRAALRPQRLRQ